MRKRKREGEIQERKELLVRVEEIIKTFGRECPTTQLLFSLSRTTTFGLQRMYKNGSFRVNTKDNQRDGKREPHLPLGIQVINLRYLERTGGCNC